MSIPWTSDLALVRAAGCADRRARRLLAERLLDRVRTTVHYLVAGDQDAEDMVQLSLEQILLSVDTFRGESKLETWADRVVVRTCMRLLRQRRRAEKVPGQDAAAPGVPGLPAVFGLPADQAVAEQEEAGAQLARDDAEGELVRRQIRRRLACLLQKVSVKRRVVILLRWVLGYSVQEIAEITSTPQNTVRDRLQVGKRQLRELVIRDPVLREWAKTWR